MVSQLTKFDALLEAGLTVNEAKVYLAMLQLGSASVNAISRKAGVHRVNAYDVVERLVQKCLVASTIHGAKRLYEPSSPHRIIDLIEEKRATITDVMPQLILDYNMRKAQEDLFVFKGPEGVMTAYRMFLEQGKPIYAIGGQGLNRKYLKHRHEVWDKERRKKGIHVYGLYFESARTTTLGDEMWHIRYLPEKFKSPMMVDVGGDLVIILLATTDIMAIVIKNRDIADGYRKHFNLLWEFAKE